MAAAAPAVFQEGGLSYSSNNNSNNNNAIDSNTLRELLAQQKAFMQQQIHLEQQQQMMMSSLGGGGASASATMTPLASNTFNRSMPFSLLETHESSSSLSSLTTNTNENNSRFRVPPNTVAMDQFMMPSNVLSSNFPIGSSTNANNNANNALVIPNNNSRTCNNGKNNSIDNTRTMSAKGTTYGGVVSSPPYNGDGGRSESLFLSCDDESLSEYQCLLRKQIEMFEATGKDISSNAKGRNKPIVLGQVGVRCVHCRDIPPRSRIRGATYYPAKLSAMYQAAQTMASRHLCYHCTRVPREIRQRLLLLKTGKSSAGGGKKYWSEAARVMGVYVCEEGLRFRSSSSGADNTTTATTTASTSTSSTSGRSTIVREGVECAVL